MASCPRTRVLILREVNDHPIGRSYRCSILLTADLATDANRVLAQGQLQCFTQLPTLTTGRMVWYVIIGILLIGDKGYNVARSLELARPIVDPSSCFSTTGTRSLCVTCFIKVSRAGGSAKLTRYTFSIGV